MLNNNSGGGGICSPISDISVSLLLDKFLCLNIIEPRHEISNNLTDSDEPLQPPFKLRNSK